MVGQKVVTLAVLMESRTVELSVELTVEKSVHYWAEQWAAVKAVQRELHLVARMAAHLVD